MSAKSSGVKSQGNSWAFSFLLSLLDILAILAWGGMLLKYWLTDTLNLLIHPDYFWLVIVTGVMLLLIGVVKLVQLLTKLMQSFSSGRKSKRRRVEPTGQLPQHITLFPPGWSSGLLLVTAILGLLITPKVFASQTANQRGITESATITRSQPQAFRNSQKPEERSLVDWARTLSVYPEPDAYTGQKVKVDGFVVDPKDAPLPQQYLLISRFVITCCAADAYPVGLPVKLTESTQTYPADTWLQIEGQMITENLNGKRQLTIAANSIKQIPQPKNPYNY